MNTKRFYLRLAAILFAGLVVTAFAYIGWAKWQRHLWELNGDEPPLAFLEAVRPVPKFRIFEGFDRVVIWPTEEGRAEAEQIIEAKKRAMQLCKYPIHPDPFELSEADAKTFLELVLKRGTYSNNLKYVSYMPECGGFNPDAIVEWEVNEKHYYLLICLGCGELQTYIEGDRHSSHNMISRNHEALRKLLKPYFKHHPQIALTKKVEASSE